MGNRPKRADTVLIDGIKLRDVRERAGFTQEMLATEVTGLEWHLSQGYLPSLEKKPTARVHKQLAASLATALGIPVNELKAAVPQGRKASNQGTSMPNAGGLQISPSAPSAGYEVSTALPSPIRVQRPQPNPQRQELDSKLSQLRQDLSEIKRKALDLAADIAEIENYIDEVEGK